jgi:aminoglycoside phosphotransferase (APT) family kinase protein
MFPFRWPSKAAAVFGVALATKGENVDAFVALLDDLASDIDGAGMDSADLRQVASIADKDRAVLDEVAEPRLLHGDLWTVNVMLAEDAPQPGIVGVFDNDRTLWGDRRPTGRSTWRARSPAGKRDAFWETYGPMSTTPAANRRALFYRARHVAAIRLERHRLGKTVDVPETYDQMRDLLGKLQA